MPASDRVGFLARLDDRGVVRLEGPDALKLLDNLVTGDVGTLLAQGGGHTALLTPQGKILFDFFLSGSPAAILLETALPKAADLAKRLTLYRLRADVRISDARADYIVAAWWGSSPPPFAGATICRDTRVNASGPEEPGERCAGRAIVPVASFEPWRASLVASGDWRLASVDDYNAWRVENGVAESGLDYPLGDTFPHEANLDRTVAVSFDKGCFVGQEVVARMQHKTVVRKRVVRVSGPVTLPADHPDVTIEAGAVIGSLGSVAGALGLAMVRLDRAEEALAKGLAIRVKDLPIEIDAAALEGYRHSRAERAQTP